VKFDAFLGHNSTDALFWVHKTVFKMGIF